MTEVLQAQNLRLQAAMEALVLAAGLRVIRPGTNDIHAEFEQPDTKPRPATLRAIAPGRAIIDQEGLWHAVAAKDTAQFMLHCRAFLVVASLKADGVARVIVDHGQRMAPMLPIAQQKAAFEIHLPDQVRCRQFETPLGGLRARRCNPIVAGQNRMDRRRRWHRPATARQKMQDLARSPGRMLVPHPQNCRFQYVGYPPGALMRTPG
jgi:hypothetical protein